MISVLILTYNEEKHIERCINSLRPITNKIYVVDSYSTDATTHIAESLGAKVYKKKWPGNHAKQFQWGLDNCNIDTEWVMKMDADETILPELADEINSGLSNIEPSVSGIYVKRRVNFMGKWIKNGGYYPTWLLRIWRFKHGIMEQRWMDEHIKLTSGTSINFRNDIVDDNLNDLSWWTDKHNKYATREAADILNTIFRFSDYDQVEPKLFGTQEQRKRRLKLTYVNLPLFFRPFLYFVYRYIFKLGFLDGRQGLVWHFLQGFWYRFLIDAKIFEIYRKNGKDRNKIRESLDKNNGVKFE